MRLSARTRPATCWTRAADELELELEIGTRGIVPEYLVHYVRIANRLRAHILRVVIDPKSDQPSPDKVVARLAPLVRIFEAADVTLAIENHDRFKAVVLLEIIESLRRPHIGVYLDTANSLGCMENFAQIVETLGPRTVNLHLRTSVSSGRRTTRALWSKVVEGRVAGQGQIDFSWVLKRRREFHVDPNAIIELWPPPEPTIEASIEKEERWAGETVAFVRTRIPPVAPAASPGLKTPPR